MSVAYRGFNRPSRFRYPSLHGGRIPPQEWPRTFQKERDEFGLSTTIYGKAPRQSRQYISMALEFLKLPKMVSPTVLFGPGAGTIPELATFGWFLANGYTYQTYAPRSFSFQDPFLGGRQSAGGAVVDLVAYKSATHIIGIDVDSVFHATTNPFMPGQKLESDRRRRVRLEAGGRLSKVMSVNEQKWGFPLEHGPDELVIADLARIEAA